MRSRIEPNVTVQRELEAPVRRRRLTLFSFQRIRRSRGRSYERFFNDQLGEPRGECRIPASTISRIFFF